MKLAITNCASRKSSSGSFCNGFPMRDLKLPGTGDDLQRLVNQMLSLLCLDSGVPLQKVLNWHTACPYDLARMIPWMMMTLFSMVLSPFVFFYKYTQLNTGLSI